MGGLVYADGLTIDLNHIHYLHRVVRVLLPLELHKAIPLVIVGDTVLGKVHVHDWPNLHKQLPHQLLRHLGVQIPHVYGGFLVAVV